MTSEYDPPIKGAIMKIIKNTTNLDNKKLQSLFSLVHNRIAKFEGRLKHWKSLKVQIQNRAYGYSGLAYVGKVYGKSWDVLLKYSADSTIEDISQLFAHELMHAYGYRVNVKYRRTRMFNRKPLLPKDIEIIKSKFTKESLIKEEKPKPKKDVISIRFTRMLKREKVWERKLKLATSHLKKVKREIKVYKKRHNKVL